MKGPVGDDGVDGRLGLPGDHGDMGADGPAGPLGSQGKPGPPGEIGPDGNQGRNGTPGSERPGKRMFEHNIIVCIDMYPVYYHFTAYNNKKYNDIYAIVSKS